MMHKKLATKIGLGFAIIGIVFMTAVVLNLVHMAKLKQTQQDLTQALNNLQKQQHSQWQRHLSNVNNIVRKDIESTLATTTQRQQSLIQIEFNHTRETVNMLSIINWVLLALGVTLCALYGLLITRLISKPVKQMVALTQSIAKGELNHDINISGAIELELLSDSLNLMVARLKELVNVTNSMALGDYRSRIAVRSSRDNLGNALNAMLDNFMIIVEQANTIASGDYSCRIQVRSENDVLVQSLRNMTTQLVQHEKSQKKQQEALECSNEKLKQASAYKSLFLTNMSHEFRTPLNSLILLAKCLREQNPSNLTTGQLDSLQIIERSGRELLDLINDILDLAKVEAGKLKFVIDNVLLAPLLAELKDDFDLVVNKKSLTFTIDCEETLPEFIETDRQRLKQILKNLIANAIKFTNQGGVTLKISKQPESQMSFAVIDTGCGISQRDQLNIFNAFTQGTITNELALSGTGLGLSISLQLAKGLNGKITLNSETGLGSQFTLHLPTQISRIEQDKTPLLMKE